MKRSNNKLSLLPYTQTFNCSLNERECHSTYRILSWAKLTLEDAKIVQEKETKKHVCGVGKYKVACEESPNLVMLWYCRVDLQPHLARSANQRSSQLSKHWQRECQPKYSLARRCLAWSTCTHSDEYIYAMHAFKRKTMKRSHTSLPNSISFASPCYEWWPKVLWGSEWEIWVLITQSVNHSVNQSVSYFCTQSVRGGKIIKYSPYHISST